MNNILKVLPTEELKEVYASTVSERRRLIVAGYADFAFRKLILFRGDGTSVVAPFSMFINTNAVVEPNFSKLGFTDYGNTVVLGDYEASVDSILSDLDPDYKSYKLPIKNIN